jgi:hypothetical protein
MKLVAVSLDALDTFPQAHLKLAIGCNGTKIWENILASRLFSSAHREWDAADLHLVRRREKPHCLRILHERMSQATTIDEAIGQSEILGDTRRMNSGRPGPDDQHIQNFRHESHLSV